MLYSHVAVQKFPLIISASGAVCSGCSVTVWKLRQALNKHKSIFQFSFEEADLSCISTVT